MSRKRYQDDAEDGRAVLRAAASRVPLISFASSPDTNHPSPSPAQQQEQHPQEPRTDLIYAVEPLYPPTSNSTSNANNSHSHNPNSGSQQDGSESDGASPEPETEEEIAAAKKAKEDADLGPHPATRMNMGQGPWKIACRMRVWDDARQHYTPSLICSLVAQETDDYFSLRGLPHPDALLFMDEEYYNRELESVSEGDGSADGSGEDGEGESFEREQQQQVFVLETTPVPDPPSHKNADASAGAGHENGGGEGSSEMDMDLGSSMGGVISSFYVALPPAHLLQGGPGPFAHMPLPLPPPPLASVQVPALRHLFTDIPIAPAAGAAREWGTPVDSAPKAAWSGRVEVTALRGGRRVEGVLDEELPSLPRLREEGEPPMLLMRGLRELVHLQHGWEHDQVIRSCAGTRGDTTGTGLGDSGCRRRSAPEDPQALGGQQGELMDVDIVHRWVFDERIPLLPAPLSLAPPPPLLCFCSTLAPTSSGIEVQPTLAHALAL
ncbi:hypothetical protein B0H14DRAFT_2588575 [Mycena olivaceomarginata]|nr:hypothetical protein B0H14DRAFT_2588575 [Mycena olivaceomarginata]